jgi:3-hydroxyacyl-[acyl-carrier-protein] dehydratase
MRFNLVDQITEVELGRKLKALKNLTLAEEYLADHFPTFPVMPGVLMLQTLVEAGAWLLRLSDDFRHSMIVLREAKNVKYGHFVQPGRQMSVAVELTEKQDNRTSFKGHGEVDGSQSVSARFVLESYNLGDRNPAWRPTDDRLIAHFRSLQSLLRKDQAPILASKS